MPDTGAPWNIPYVTSADLVSDWPADSLALANAIDAGLDAAGNAGIGSNVVSNVVTASFTTTSATFVNTNITATITPTSASSKVLVLVSIGGLLSQTANKDAFLALYRGDVTGTQLGDEFAYLLINVASVYVPTAFVYLDSPATTSAQEYRVALRTVAGGTTVATTGEQVITLIEVAA